MLRVRAPLNPWDQLPPIKSLEISRVALLNTEKQPDPTSSPLQTPRNGKADQMAPGAWLLSAGPTILQTEPVLIGGWV